MRFQSLPAQVAAHLQAEIEAGRWTDFLPGERALATQLRVSRRTLTVALAQLQRAGLVKSEAARGHRVVGRKAAGAAGAAAAVPRQIALLTPTPLALMRPGAMLWVNELQAQLAEAGFRLNQFHGEKFSARQPARALARLVSAHPQTAWLLASSGEPLQRWFAREAIPTVVVGTCHGGVVLPDVDLDFAALGRHAAGRIAAKRHRRAALFLTNAPGYFTSEAETERGFREVLAQAGAEAVAIYHERNRDGLARTLRRLPLGPGGITALVVTNSLDYLTTISVLTQRGLRVPQDVSVLARNDDTFMRALLPEPTRYHANPPVMARSIFRLLMQVIEGQAPTRPHVRIMPDFIAGESLALAPGAGRS